MSKRFNDWYENHPTSCDAKQSHIEGRIFTLKWMLKKIGVRSPDGRLGQQGFVDKLKESVEKELLKMEEELK